MPLGDGDLLAGLVLHIISQQITTLVALSMFEQLLESLHQLDDTEAQATLVSLRGIGPWSAQMFLLHELKRPDVFPAGDIGLWRWSR